MGKAQLEELQKHGMYLSSPKGVSMYPMIRQGKDVVEIHTLQQSPKRYDLVMYTRNKNEQGVIHRILFKKKDIYIINGDNFWQKEYVKPEQIAGIVTRFYRNGRWHEINEIPYQLYVHLWTDLYPIRALILRIRDYIKRHKR